MTVSTAHACLYRVENSENRPPSKCYHTIIIVSVRCVAQLEVSDLANLIGTSSYRLLPVRFGYLKDCCNLRFGYVKELDCCKICLRRVDCCQQGHFNLDT